MAKTSKDIRAYSLQPLAWDPTQAAESLSVLAAHASTRAGEAIEWYLRAKTSKRRGARWLRLWAIILTTSAGILPIIQQIWVTPDGKPPFAPAWASVLLALALFLVAIDRFFGFSNAWIRYITAELQIKQAREAFDLDWQAAYASFAGQAPTADQVRAVITTVKAFVDQVNTLIAAETAKWVSDFQEVLRQIDETIKAPLQAAQTGSLAVTVDNGDQVDAPGWTLVLDQSAPMPYSGKTAALPGLTAGDHVVRVAATKGTRQVRAEAVATIRPGAPTAVQLSLT